MILTCIQSLSCASCYVLLQSRTKIMRIYWKITFSHLSKQQSPLPPNQCCGSRPSIRETNFTTLIWGKGGFVFISQKFLSGIVEASQCYNYGKKLSGQLRKTVLSMTPQAMYNQFKRPSAGSVRELYYIYRKT